MDKITIWFIVGFVVLVAAVVIVAGVMSGGFDTGAPTSTPAGFVATTVPPIAAGDWSQGPANAPLSLIEYGDFECPACAEYEPIIRQLLTAYSGKIHFSFRNFPLYSIHPDGGIAAQAAEAAGLQGKYWEMHDLLYAKQNDWVSVLPASVVQSKFNGYAQSLGLDVTKFDADIKGSKVANKIQNDVTTGNAAQIDHTPTFFVNDKQIPNPASYNDFKTVIDEALGSGAAAPAVSASTTGGTGTLTVTSTPFLPPAP